MTKEEVEALNWEAVESSNVRRLAWVPRTVIQAMDQPDHQDQSAGDMFVDFGTETSPSVYRYAGVTQNRLSERAPCAVGRRDDQQGGQDSLSDVEGRDPRVRSD